ncbi:MAG: (2Fe-2S)-binding protein [Candidatus Aureabacteria bacterium]|nr:(2Fe-2S)-binding protein [Candidatus Auribacterota bacterium]
MIKVKFVVNGKNVAVESSPTKTLLDILREDLGLTGTKEGCGKGECGACTVIMDGKAVTSCIVIAAQLEGKNILTVEGLSADRIGKALQDAFVDSGAVQCGYCIPGFLMSARALLEENPDPTLDEIKEGLSGNICRCTGYVKIFDGVRLAAARLGK